MTEEELCSCLKSSQRDSFSDLERYMGQFRMMEIIYGFDLVVCSIYAIHNNDTLLKTLMLLSYKGCEPQLLANIIYGIISETIMDPIESLSRIIRFENQSPELTRKIITTLCNRIIYFKPHIIDDDIRSIENIKEQNMIQLKEFMNDVAREHQMKELKELQDYVEACKEIRNTDQSKEESILKQFEVIKQLCKRQKSSDLCVEYQQLYDRCQ